ncbi:hypothetical protein ACFWMP_19365 [Paenibacillus sp. NPDC058367]|uniref:hypothetical protein n=1 Tax=Paenibacillus sp. NPDC058367 TaxID=3346460 RepID=UPI00364CA682
MLEELVDKYLKTESLYRDRLNKYKKTTNLNELLEYALPGADPDGEYQFDPHQYRISNKEEIYRRIIDTILSNPNIVSSLNNPEKFEDVFDVFSNIRKAKLAPGFGPLSVYDVSLRVAVSRGVFPEVVYLHAGALKGAKQLLADDFKGKKNKYKDNRDHIYIHHHCFPLEVQKLEAFQIEDFLCNYKDFFKKPIR